MKKTLSYKRLVYRIVQTSLLQLALAIVFASITMATPVKGQIILDRKVTLNVTDLPLEKALLQLEKTAQVKFSFNSRALHLDRTVTINANNEALSSVLTRLLKPMNIKYILVSNRIVLRKEEDAPKVGLIEESLPAKPADNQFIDQNVTGTVTDETGAGLPGVSVAIKGTTKGTNTDANGKFKIDVPNGKAILVFSFVGYVLQEIEVGNQAVLNISLKADTKVLSEVVVVGYGVQKKANLTGAVDQVSSEVFDNRPLTNLNQGLQGVMPNLNIKMGDGKPNQAPSFNIRGTTSIGQGGSALVLIDNVEGDPSLLNPNDIATITLLKDAASASIYGARGVFGVVLITTKNPTAGKTNITYSSNYSFKKPIAKPNLVTDGYTWASMFAESFVNFQGTFPQNVNKTLKFSQAYLNEIKRRSEVGGLPEVDIDPVTGEYAYYGNTAYYDILYKDVNHANEQNISISGSSDKASYLLTGRYFGQEGLFRYNSDDYRVLNFTGKGSIQLYPWLKVTNMSQYSDMKYHNPLNVGEGGGVCLVLK